MAADDREVCGARNRSRGGTCKNRPVKGSTRCRLHGGHPRSGRPPIHGRYSKRFAKIAPASQEAIDEALQDPELLDPRRPVAVQQAILQNSALMPDDDVIESYARHLSKWRPNYRADETWADQPRPTDGEIEVARMLWAEQATRLTEAYGRLQNQSSRTLRMGQLLAKQVVPLLSEVGLRLSKLVDRYVPEEHRGDFNQAFRMEARRAVLDIVNLTED